MTPIADDARLAEREETFDTVMLCTTSSAGTIHARPMVVAEVDESNCWWFVSPRDSVACHEIEASPYAAVTMQGSTSYATVTGRAAVVARADRMKTAPPAEQLDGGVPDADTVFICFQPTLCAHWGEGASEPTELDAGEARSLLSGHAIDAERAAAHAEKAASVS
jgi:general stress protein 26